MTAESGAALEIQEDRSLFVTGANPDKETYSISFEATEQVRSFRLEIFTDERLPNSGPGRSPNGNIVQIPLNLHSTELAVEGESNDE